MSQRRMFSPQIVSSEEFLTMPVSSQALYFHLAMGADDDGFIQPKIIMRSVGSNDDDLKVLLSKRFLLQFEAGVVVIKHWLIHNLIRADLYKETRYKNEKSQLGLNENGAYTELREGVSELKQIEAPQWLKKRKIDARTARVPQTAHRIGKDRIGKDRIDKNTASASAPPIHELLIDDQSKNSNDAANAAGRVKKEKKDPNMPMTLAHFTGWCAKSPHRHIKIIGMYAGAKKVEFTTLGQWQRFINRNLRPARNLVPFSDDQLMKAAQEIHGAEWMRRWTLETIEKFLVK